MTIYARFNASGFVVGFWTEEYFPPTGNEEDGFVRNSGIPDEAIEITEAEYAQLVERQQSLRLVGDVLVEYVPVVVPYMPPRVPQLLCLANLTIVDGEVSGIETATGLNMAMVWEPGVYWLFFDEPMSDLNYTADASADVPGACVKERTTDYIEVRVGAEGAYFDPKEISIRVYRVLQS